MKTPVLFLLSLFLLLNHYSFSQVTFRYKMKGPTSLYLHNMIITQDQGAIVLGTDQNSIGNNFFIMKIGSDGNIKWSNHYGTGEFERLTSIAATNDNGFIVIFFSYNDTTKHAATRVMKCDSSGKIEWKRKLLAKSTQSFSSAVITQTKKGDFLLSGYASDSDIVVIKMDSKGKLIWNRSYVFGDVDFGYWVDAIAEGPDEGIILSVEEGGCEAYCTWNYLIRLNKNGDWKKGTYNEIPGKQNPTVQLIASENNNIHVLYKMDESWGNDSYYGYLTYDSDTGKSKITLIPDNIFSLRNFLKKNSIHVFDGYAFPQTDNHPYHFSVIMKNRSIINAIVEYITTEKKEMKIDQYDELGRICPDFKKPVFNDTTATRHFATYAFTLPEKPDKILVSQTDDIYTATYNDIKEICRGIAPSFVSSQEYNNLNATDVVVYPNPTKNYLNIIFNEVKQDDYSITLYDLQGKLLMHKKGNSFSGKNDVRFDVHELSPGTYILKLQFDKDKIVMKKFVKD